MKPFLIISLLVCGLMRSSYQNISEETNCPTLLDDEFLSRGNVRQTFYFDVLDTTSHYETAAHKLFSH